MTQAAVWAQSPTVLLTLGTITRATIEPHGVFQDGLSKPNNPYAPSQPYAGAPHPYVAAPQPDSGHV